MLIIYDAGRYHLRIGNIWHMSQSEAEAKALGASFDDLLRARSEASPVHPVHFDGKHYRIGPCVLGITDARAHLRDVGLTIKEANTILSAARLLHRISPATPRR